MSEISVWIRLACSVFLIVNRIIGISIWTVGEDYFFFFKTFSSTLNKILGIIYISLVLKPKNPFPAVLLFLISISSLLIGIILIQGNSI